MWTRRTLFASATAAGLASPRPAFARMPATDLGRRAEVEAIRRFAEATHPRGRDARSDADWIARWDALAAVSETDSDGGYVVGIRRALAWFRDGHTTVAVHANGETPEPLRQGEWSLKVPLTLDAFDDGLWVTAAAEDAGDLLGKRLLSIEDVPVNEILRRHADCWTGSDAWAHAWAGEVLISMGDLTGLNVVRQPGRQAVRFAVQDADGHRIERALMPTAQSPELRSAVRMPGDIERWTVEAGGRNFLRVIEDGRTLFLSLDQMGDVDGHGFIDLTRSVIAALSAPALQRIVIDLRRNLGGNNGLGEPLRKHLERSRLNRPGGIYVLAGPRTFSAAQNLATRLERETYALFAGGPSGGAPNHYGDASRMIGEATGLPIFVSSLPWFDSAPQDQRPWILPDLPSSSTWSDWQSGADPALAAVLADATSGPGDDVTLLRTFPYRRPSQTVGWTPFWRTV